MNALLDEFNGDWVVPNNPAAGYTGQLLYFFTGLEYDGTSILQPVVWYGVSPAGGGAGWFAAVWYVYNGNANYVTSPVVQVSSGQTIHTTMNRAIGTGWVSYMYANGAQITAAWFPDGPYSNAFVTLEVYNVANCNSLPYYQGTEFQNLAIVQEGVGPVGFNNADWAIFVTQTDCGQNMACNGNLCNMVYGAWYPCPSNILGTTYIPTNGVLYSRGTAYAVAPDCRIRLVMQDDGNLVLYNQYYQALWSSQTSGHGVAPFFFFVQGDGNLVIYDSNDTPTWWTGTTGQGQSPWVLVPQDDGNLVLYDANDTPIWYTATQG